MAQTLKNPSFPTDKITFVGFPPNIMLVVRIWVIMLGCADLLYYIYHTWFGILMKEDPIL